MKTLKWSSIALVFLCIFSSCTKSSNNLTESATAGKAGIGSSNLSGDDVAPGLQVTFNPSPATEGQTVTVTGSFDGSTTVPDCGKLELQQKVNGQWVSAGDPVDVTATSHEVTYQFTPVTVGEDVYEFRVHYIVAGCQGFDNSFSGSYFLDVEAACHGLTLTGNVVSAVPAENGLYLFTVNYTVNTCGIEYTYLKTQGGLTAWSTDVVSTTPPATVTAVGNSSHPNSIIKWEENVPFSGSKTYSVTFKKAWSGSGPVELTGTWSVTATNNGVEVARVEFDGIIHQ